MTVLTILQPGLAATLQDRGRFGYLQRGISLGGPMDENAFLWANRLLLNDSNCAQIEVTMGGFKGLVEQSTWFSLTGGLNWFIDQHPVKAWQSHFIEAGSTIEARPGAGLRGYLAVLGGFKADQVYGSVATVSRDQLGGLQGQGQLLQVNDELCADAAPAHASTQINRRPQRQFIPNYSDPLEIPLIATGQYEMFSAPMRELFTRQSYTVTAEQDRMGMRLEGDEPIKVPERNLISEPLPVGAVQVPAGGQPIVMLRDRQSLGGYHKIGTVTWHGLNRLSQAVAGTKLRFYWQSMAAAEAEYVAVMRFFNLAR